MFCVGSHFETEKKALGNDQRPHLGHVNVRSGVLGANAKSRVLGMLHSWSSPFQAPTQTVKELNGLMAVGKTKRKAGSLTQCR